MLPYCMLCYVAARTTTIVIFTISIWIILRHLDYSVTIGKRTNRENRGLSPCLPSAVSDVLNDRDKREGSLLLDACDRASSVAPMGGTPSRRGPSKERRRVQERTRQNSEFVGLCALAIPFISIS